MKNTKIVNIRALAIILVVLGHSIILYSSQWDLYETINQVPILDNMKRIIDIIQMALFFSISGFLFYYSKNKRINFFTFFKNKFFRLLIPYICISVAWMIPIRLLVGYSGYQDTPIKKVFFNSIFYGIDCGHLWFLPTLFLIFVEMYFLTYFTSKVSSNKLIDILLFLVLTLLSMIYNNIPNFVPFTSKSAEFLIWFYMGYLLNKYKDDLLKLNKFKYFQCILLIFCIIYWWNYGGVVSAFLTKILMILNIYMFIPSKSNKCVEIISDNSFGIYLFHSPLIYITFSMIPNLSPILIVTLNFVVFGGVSLIMSLAVKKTKLKFIIGE